ncbi:MAG: MCE family protein, partial [Burkholderiales bacterium]|nr:MCE family protein [Burkholderiales bacterium]
MADAPHSPPPPGLPELPEAVAAAPRSGRSLQLVWLIPLVAALVGGWLAVKSILEKGPTITITFLTAEGLEAGKTKIRYKDVQVGLVTDVSLSPDASRVVVTAELVRDARKYLVEDARFWVVRPRISGGTVSGLGTLLSGSYVGMDIGKSDKPRSEFVGLEVPPVIATGLPGREFVLHAGNIGSLDVGSPVYFRRLQAGQVSGHSLDKGGKGVTIKVFINAPYDRFVNTNTRFWQASGIDLSLDASGIKVTTESIVSILIGGLAFETPVESADLPPAAADTQFRLFPNAQLALKNPEPDVMRVAMVFKESTRGLTVGAPIDFRGIVYGHVTAISPVTEKTKKTRQFNIKVEAEVYPQRMRPRDAGDAPVLSNDRRRALQNTMIERGLRAQLRTGSLLTGQLYVALDVFPDQPKIKRKPIQKGEYAADELPEIPTIPSSLLELQETLSSIGRKIDRFPLDAVGADLQATLKSATRMMNWIEADLAPEARTTLVELRATLTEARKALDSADQVLKPGSPLSQDARDAMREFARAAAAVRVLADYLERHPDALL